MLELEGNTRPLRSNNVDMITSGLKE